MKYVFTADDVFDDTCEGRVNICDSAGCTQTDVIPDVSLARCCNAGFKIIDDVDLVRACVQEEIFEFDETSQDCLVTRTAISEADRSVTREWLSKDPTDTQRCCDAGDDRACPTDPVTTIEYDYSNQWCWEKVIDESGTVVSESTVDDQICCDDGFPDACTTSSPRDYNCDGEKNSLEGHTDFEEL